ncbi:cephalosporin hydroxylase family protein [Pseudohoeflea coraliihabitans]|uniref:Cephalosporin hydroxylase family protein n=1 Tax=Pseudohoeflea coraliihabitans TaxID=2860393 RepID=A0ABS6WN19_9HYPH|nr:cephalosporin hydroxylase family protein [Pseudohoeflea sp. DP4N28-3]MBW3097300.1 cephalosporin hydroxylase family protein [Pseudohoeflea sp. DP4N28-3]
MTADDAFRAEVADNIASLGRDRDLQALSRIWTREVAPHKWSYNFRWLGRPAIQYPNDAWALQELIHAIRPDLIIETGIAHGGSLVFSASMLALLDYSEASERGETLDPRAPKRKVLGIDIDIRAHNRDAIESHPMAPRIDMIEGSSIDPAIVDEVKARAAGSERVLVCLDSNHTHDHVLGELEAYAPLVSPGSYIIVYDTIIDDLPEALIGNRPWGAGSNPKTAVHAFLQTHPDFVIDEEIDHKLQISVAPQGFLRRVA